MNAQGIQITDTPKSSFFIVVRLILCTKETVPLIGPALPQVKPTQEKGQQYLHDLYNKSGMTLSGFAQELQGLYITLGGLGFVYYSYIARTSFVYTGYGRDPWELRSGSSQARDRARLGRTPPSGGSTVRTGRHQLVISVSSGSSALPSHQNHPRRMIVCGKSVPLTLHAPGLARALVAASLSRKRAHIITFGWCSNRAPEKKP